MSTTTTTLDDFPPGREDIRSIAEATVWYVFVGALGAAVGINTYARKLNAEFCDPGAFVTMNPCTSAVVSAANQYTGIASLVALGAFMLGVGFMAADWRGEDDA